ncbi:MAG TPA: hypothetical protein VN766_04060 [Stellaceae bacterium]|nr:hypothetical protein [Stellaceae bacterium]
MANLGAGDEDRELWRRWRALGEVAPAPDAMELAAYAEQRLGESEAASVEDWLATNPTAWSELAAARGAAEREGAPVDAALIARACALVTGTAGLPRDGTVVPLRRPTPAWRSALAWSSVAASLIATSLVGFSMGSDAYRSLSGPQVAAASDPLEASPALDTYFGDDSGT